MNLNVRKSLAALAAFALPCAVFSQELDAVRQIGAKMVAVEGGVFSMGSLNNESNEQPVREVTLDGFLIMQTEVTQAEYRAVTGLNYSANKSPEHPVEEVSWYDAVVFCNRLSVLAGLTPVYALDGATDTDAWGAVPRMGAPESETARWNSITCDFAADGYRLPTEAEWEYAAGAGGTPSLYSGSSFINDVAWYSANAGGATHAVAEKHPNAYGIYDLNGNVWEWCWDWYGNYKASDTVNPRGEQDSGVTGRRIRRGGSFRSDAVFCRNANRASSVPELRGVDLGFRVARSMPGVSSGTGSHAAETFDDLPPFGSPAVEK